MEKKEKTLLYVDDELQNLQGFKITYHNEFTIYTAGTIAEALEILKKTEIKVVISDQRMPEMTGLEFLSIVKREFPDIVCIILTAYADTGAVIQAVNQGGVYRFMLKPWNELELKISIDQALERYYYKKENKILLDDLKAKNNELSLSNEELYQTTLNLKEREFNLKEQNEEYLALNEELTQTIAELEAAKEKAEESDRLKRSFLQNISHEIRTPMNSIIGFSSLLNDPELQKESIEQYTNIIKKSGQQLLSIVNDVLTISTIETGQEKINTVEINVLQLMQDLKNIFENPAEQKGLQLIMDHHTIDPNLFIITDLTKLQQILSNLITNAIKYTHVGKVEFGCDINDNYIDFYVKDTGIGINSEHHNLIFDRFSRVASEKTTFYGGTGLGLAISKAMIDLLGGSIRVNSEVDKGSVFIVSFPTSFIKLKDTFQDNILDINHLPKMNILIVEDEYDNYLFISELLKKSQIKIAYAQNGLEAIEMVNNKLEIDLILMDIKMPEMDGFEASRLIKIVSPTMPIIAQTAYTVYKEDFTNSTLFDAYISKPIDREELIKLLSMYKNKR